MSFVSIFYFLSFLFLGRKSQKPENIPETQTQSHAVSNQSQPPLDKAIRSFVLLLGSAYDLYAWMCVEG